MGPASDFGIARTGHWHLSRDLVFFICARGLSAEKWWQSDVADVACEYSELAHPGGVRKRHRLLRGVAGRFLAVAVLTRTARPTFECTWPVSKPLGSVARPARLTAMAALRQPSKVCINTRQDNDWRLIPPRLLHASGIQLAAKYGYSGQRPLADFGGSSKQPAAAHCCPRPAE